MLYTLPGPDNNIFFHLAGNDMNNEDIRNALDSVNTAHQLFRTPSGREEEEIFHLLNAIQWRLEHLYTRLSVSEQESLHYGSQYR